MSAINNYISLVMPTYTGADNINNSLDSIVKQKITNYEVELIVIIDGPNKRLFESIEAFQPKFEKAGKKLKVKMLTENQGRFKATQMAAKIARGKWLVFMGDRITLPEDYLAKMSGLKKEIAIADTIENGWENSAINMTLHHIRSRLYKKRGIKHKPFFITKENFEKSGKGSGGMWLKKDLYLWACSQIKDANQKHTSDDTKLLRVLVESNHPIYWTNCTQIVYWPRNDFLSQIDHIYKRGPRFVNYYIRPGTRYFLPLNLTILMSLAALILLIVKPVTLLWALGVVAGLLVLATFYLMEKPRDLLRLIWTLPLMLSAFYLGILKGFVIYFTHGKSHSVS